MIDNTTSTTTSTTGTATYTCTCGHYLPCGYCAIMKSPCPMRMTIGSPIVTPTWSLNEVTCQAKEET